MNNKYNITMMNLRMCRMSYNRIQKDMKFELYEYSTHSKAFLKCHK